MSGRSPPGGGRRSPAKAKVSEGGNSNGGGGSGADDGGCMIGRKILKRQGDTIVHGYVKEYKPPAGGKKAAWTLRYENPVSEEDEDSEMDEEVNRAELDKRLNLQAVKEREFPTTPSAKRGRGRPRKSSSSDTSSSASSMSISSASSSGAGSASKPATKKKKKKTKNKSLAEAAAAAVAAASSPKRASNGISGGGGSGKKRSSPADSDADLPIKKKKKKQADDSTTLRGNAADLGKRVAKEFTEGIFTGEVVEVKPKGPRGSLWKIEYEDEDGEDLNEEEMKRHTHTYKLLADRFAAAKGKAVTADDLAAEGLDEEEDVGAALSQGSSSGRGTPKGKGKGKKAKASAKERLVGVGITKFFPSYDEYFDGKVSKFFPEESDDEHGDLWLIKYEDGDAEHLDLDELNSARALYNKRHALVKKRVAFPTNTLIGGIPATNPSQKGAKITLYGETPAKSRGIFSTIAGYRRYKNKEQES